MCEEIQIRGPRLFKVLRKSSLVRVTFETYYDPVQNNLATETSDGNKVCSDNQIDAIALH